MNNKINITLGVLCAFSIIAIVVIKLLLQLCFPCYFNCEVFCGINEIIVNLCYNVIGGCIIYYLTVITIQRAKRKQYKYIMYDNYREMCYAIRECSNHIIGDCFLSVSNITSIARNENGDFVINSERSDYLRDMNYKLTSLVSRALEYADFLSDRENNLLVDIRNSFVLDQIAESRCSFMSEIWIHENQCQFWITGLKSLESHAEELYKIGHSYIKK